MSPSSLDSKKMTTARHREPRRIKSDRVNPTDLARYDVRFFCEDCSHYNSATKQCMMGYVSRHTREQQLAFYKLTGRIEFCRFLEID